MSQSDAHKNLVIEVSTALTTRYPMISITADVQQLFGHSVPPIVGGFRPDVYGKMPGSDATVIAEAKTCGDLDNKHTHNQITAFLRYLEKKRDSLFILSVPGDGADLAKTLLRFMRQDIRIEQTGIEIFDGSDFWILEPTGGRMWHLY